MLKRPAFLTRRFHFAAAGAGLLFASVSSALRQLLAVPRLPDMWPTDVPPARLRYPMDARALRLMRSNDSF